MRRLTGSPAALLRSTPLLLLAALTAASALVGAAPRLEAQEAVADSLVRRWIEAAGGMENYHRMQSASFTLVTELYDPGSGRLRRARPRYVRIARLPSGEAARIERWEGEDFIVQVFDGEEARAWTNGEPLGPGEKDFEETRYVAGDVFYWVSLPWKLEDPGVRLHYEGRDDEGRKVVAVTFGPDVGDHQDRWYYLFEDGRSWPVEIRYVEEGREDINRTFWRDIRSVDGYVFAGERVHIDGEGRVVKILRTMDFELNPEIDEEVFRER